jgi:hypothetical protein
MRHELNLTPLQLVVLARNLLITVVASIPGQTRSTPEEQAVELIGLPDLYVSRHTEALRAELREWFRAKREETSGQ